MGIIDYLIILAGWDTDLLFPAIAFKLVPL